MTPHKDSTFGTDHLRALHQVGKLVTASLDLDSTLSAILEAAHQLTGAHLLAILLFEEDAEHLVIRVGRGDVAAAVGERVRADHGVVGRALREREPVLVADMLAEAARARPDLDARSGLRTYLVAPLVWREEALGAVTVGSPEPHALSATDAALIRELADQAAAAVAHARDYSREQAGRVEMEILYRDLAERTAALERAQQQLVQTEKLAAIGQLAHGIAHELNTPLGVIVSNLSVLGQYGDALANVANAAQQAVGRLRVGETAGPIAETLEATLCAADMGYVLEDLPQLLGESTASADRIAAIVRSVATFARRDADRVGPVDVEEALEAAVTLVSNEVKRRALLVRSFSGIPAVLGHTSELTQVFVHLLLNAAQALDEQHGTISIGTESDAQGVVVTIADTGCGIAPDHLQRVFDPFFTTRPPGHGTGMGLAVCHGIITRHGGAISLESTPGQGTQVTVRLPARASEALAA
jgi:signal transduction histidine kinase